VFLAIAVHATFLGFRPSEQHRSVERLTIINQ
jgi:hypothetical protein